MPRTSAFQIGGRPLGIGQASSAINQSTLQQEQIIRHRPSLIGRDPAVPAERKRVGLVPRRTWVAVSGWVLYLCLCFVAPPTSRSQGKGSDWKWLEWKRGTHQQRHSARTHSKREPMLRREGTSRPVYSVPRQLSSLLLLTDSECDLFPLIIWAAPRTRANDCARWKVGGGLLFTTHSSCWNFVCDGVCGGKAKARQRSTSLESEGSGLYKVLVLSARHG